MRDCKSAFPGYIGVGCGCRVWCSRTQGPTARVLLPGQECLRTQEGTGRTLYLFAGEGEGSVWSLSLFSFGSM